MTVLEVTRFQDSWRGRVTRKEALRRGYGIWVRLDCSNSAAGFVLPALNLMISWLAGIL